MSISRRRLNVGKRDWLKNALHKVAVLKEGMPAGPRLWLDRRRAASGLSGLPGFRYTKL
jgi:hypothetical protein